MQCAIYLPAELLSNYLYAKLMPSVFAAEHCRCDAIVTSYEIAMKDIGFLARHQFK